MSEHKVQETNRQKRKGHHADAHVRMMTLKERRAAFRHRMAQRFWAHKVIAPVRHAGALNEIWPVTYAYGIRSRAYSLGYHTGEDHACPVGSLAIATTYGHVVNAGPADNASGWGSDYGIHVLIRTADGKYDYAHNHLHHVAVKNGQEVQPGMVVGYTGETGNVTGPHSHFEARPAGGGFGTDVHPYLVKKKAH